MRLNKKSFNLDFKTLRDGELSTVALTFKTASLFTLVFWPSLLN